MSQPRNPAEGWFRSRDGQRYWGRFGAAGTLIVSPHRSVLLQLRAGWTHTGGTWGIPGGAIHQHEGPVAGSLRELREEVSMPKTALAPASTWIMDRGDWRYTTVVLRSAAEFAAAPADHESDQVKWVPLDDVERLPLHHGFRASWPGIRANLHWRPTLVVPDEQPLPSFPAGVPAKSIGLRGHRWYPRAVHLAGALRAGGSSDRPIVWVGPKDSRYARLEVESAGDVLRFPSLSALER